MKAQKNETHPLQSLSNRIMMVAILVFGSVLFVVSGKNYWQNTFYKTENTRSFYDHKPFSNELLTLYAETDRENTGMEPLVPIGASVYVTHHQNFELGKLKNFIDANDETVFHLMLNSLAETEEPEMLIEELLGEMKNRESGFNRLIDRYSMGETNVYLNDLYLQKNFEILNEIEKSWQAQNYARVENESSLEVENWMTSGQGAPAMSHEFENLLSEKLAFKNAIIRAEIEFEETIAAYLAVEEEEPLEMVTLATGPRTAESTPVAANDLLARELEGKNTKIRNDIEFDNLYALYLAVENEQPLQLEKWMVDARCWCPDKKKTTHGYTESFALNN